MRDGAHVRNKAAYLVVGVDTDGIKHVLGIWIANTEGSKFWMSVFSELMTHQHGNRFSRCTVSAKWKGKSFFDLLVHMKKFRDPPGQ